MAAEKSNMAMDNDERKEAVPSHLFVELTSLAELSFPTTASSRIKYTCVCASPHILAVGSSSGTVYLFSRYAAKNRKSLCNVPVQVIPCQEGAITLVEISPDEKSVAVATSRGFICVLNITRNHSTMILNSVLHVGSEITCFRFSLNGSRLFAGDSLGRVSCSKLSSKLSLRSPCELILRLDSRVVQIDQYHSQLLVSTLSRCYLHNLARQTTCQIGSKLRNGMYGACFFASDAARDSDDPSVSVDSGAIANNYSPLIFCARPGGRLWEVDGQGKVYSTHQFGSIQNVWSVAGFKAFNVTAVDSASNIAFSTVNVLSEFILSAGGRTLTLVDPKRGKLVLVADVGEDFAQFCVCANDVFLLTSDGYLRKVTLFTLEKAIEKLQFRERFNAAAQVVCAVFEADKTFRFRIDTLRSIRSHLEGLPEATTFVQKVDEIIQEAANRSFDTSRINRVPQVAKLASGIHKVVKGMDNSGYEDDFTFRMPSNRRGERSSRDRTMSRSPYNSLTRRSKSASSVKKFSVTAGVTGNGEAFVDVPLDGELENVAREISDTYGDHGHGDTGAASDFRSLGDYGMNISRSEETLFALMNERRSAEYEYNQNIDEDDEVSERGSEPLHSQGNQPSISNSRRHAADRLPPSVGSAVNQRPKAQYFAETSLIDDPLAITPAALKETLKTGGRFLIDAVQKMSLLSMGPDFGDPTYFVNGSNGLYENEEIGEAEEDDAESEQTTSDVAFAQFVPENEPDYGTTDAEQKPLAEAPVVQRVLRPGAGGRVRLKRPKKDGKSNGFVAKEVVVPTSPPIAETKTAKMERSGGDDKAIDEGAVSDMASKPLRQRCEHCGLHNTWRFVLTLGPPVGKLNQSPDYYKEGGIPTDPSSWQDLLSQWKRRRSAVTVASHLCSGCARMWSSWFQRHSADKATVITCDGASGTMESVIARIPDEMLARVFDPATKQRPFRDAEAVTESGATVRGSNAKSDKSTHPATVQVGPSDDTAMAVSMYYNPLYESVYNGENGDVDGKDVWQWLATVPLDVLLAVGVTVIGFDAIVDVVLKSVQDLGDDLTAAFYQFINGASDHVSMNPKVLECIALDAFGLSAGSSIEVDDKFGAKAVRIDIREFCPCCTLPLTTVVAETDQRIFIFECGHSYHKICLLSHAKPPYSCLICSLASA